MGDGGRAVHRIARVQTADAIRINLQHDSVAERQDPASTTKADGLQRLRPGAFTHSSLLPCQWRRDKGRGETLPHGKRVTRKRAADPFCPMPTRNLRPSVSESRFM